MSIKVTIALCHLSETINKNNSLKKISSIQIWKSCGWWWHLLAECNIASRSYFHKNGCQRQTLWAPRRWRKVSDCYGGKLYIQEVLQGPLRTKHQSKPRWLFVCATLAGVWSWPVGPTDNRSEGSISVSGGIFSKDRMLGQPTAVSENQEIFKCLWSITFLQQILIDRLLL